MPKPKRKGPKPGTIYKDVPRTKVGLNITSVRRRKGMSQERLAEKVGLDKATISFYERRCKSIPVGALIRIAKALNVSVDFLLTGEASTADLSASKELLTQLEKVKTMSPEKQKLIMDLINQLSSN